MLTTCKLQQELQHVFGMPDADFAYHESDMYVVYRADVFDWLRKHQPHLHLSSFISPQSTGWNGAGRVCLEVLFAAMDELVSARRPKRSKPMCLEHLLRRLKHIIVLSGLRGKTVAKLANWIMDAAKANSRFDYAGNDDYVEIRANDEPPPLPPIDGESLSTLLLLVDVEAVSVAELDAWPQEWRDAAQAWAGAVFFKASDNNAVVVPPCPVYVPPGETDLRLAKAESAEQLVAWTVFIDCGGSEHQSVGQVKLPNYFRQEIVRRFAYHEFKDQLVGKTWDVALVGVVT